MTLMSALNDKLFRHPRRMGFVAFNAIVLILLVSWILITRDSESLGVFGLPFYAMGYVAMAFLAVAWLASWIAWIWMVATRRRRDQADRASSATALPSALRSAD